MSAPDFDKLPHLRHLRRQTGETRGRLKQWFGKIQPYSITVIMALVLATAVVMIVTGLNESGVWNDLWAAR
ncbi:MAG: hypothetical protein HZA93_19275 [Verrucomicrobia bacterium]|nr:hypothetical protein [Verrucomicrobiota bacterium]